MALNLREIVTISGRSGLFRVISPARSGILVETLDEPRTRLLIPAQQQVSSLGDISLYTTSADGTVALGDVLQAIRRHYGPALDLTAKSDPQSLVTFIRQVVPDYDVDRVYLSDVKKLVTWYNVLGPHLADEAAEVPEAATEPAPAAPAAEEKEVLSTGGAVPPQAADAADGQPVV